MLTMARICKWLGNAWIVVAVLFVLANYASIWYLQGWGKLVETASPYNIVNFVLVLLAVAPGIGLLKLGEYLRGRA